MQTKKRCLVCEKEVDTRLVETYGEYSILECATCELQFAHPLTYSRDNYDKAYEGEGKVSDIHSYPRHLARGLALIEQGGRSWFEMSAYEQLAIKWLRNNLSASSYVLDLGCGGGRFLGLLRKYEFSALGMDVASRPIEILKEKGFQVAQGSIEDYPGHWPNPSAITSTKVLEHLPDPMDFLRRIIARFPETPLIVSVPSPRRFTLQNNSREGFDYPPHHLTRWSEKALLIALNKAGYRSKVIVPGVSSWNITGSGIGGFLNRILASNRKPENVLSSGSSRLPVSEVTLLFKIRRVLYWPYAVYLTFRGYSDTSMVGIGIPQRCNKVAMEFVEKQRDYRLMRAILNIL